MRSSREQWRRRVEQWRNSGKAARDFAEEAGFNLGTFKHWIYAIGKESRGRATQSKRSVGGSSVRRNRPTVVARRVSPNSLFELQPAIVTSESRFEVELGRGRRLRVPSQFDPQVLKQLISVLEGSE